MDLKTFSRRLRNTGAGLLALAVLGTCGRPPSATPKDELLYIGTNVAGEQDNTVFLYRVSGATGAFTRLSAQHGGASPTYLTIRRTGTSSTP